MFFLSKMQVLLQCGENRKVIFAATLNEIVKKANYCFEIGDNVIVQRYDKEWNEYIDVDSFDDIFCGDKLNILALKNQNKRENTDICKLQVL